MLREPFVFLLGLLGLLGGLSERLSFGSARDFHAEPRARKPRDGFISFCRSNSLKSRIALKIDSFTRR